MYGSTAVSKRVHISNTMQALTQAGVPGMPKVMDSIEYTAPELMNNVWISIYHHLVAQTPAGDHPPWVAEAQQIWNDACKAYPD